MRLGTRTALISLVVWAGIAAADPVDLGLDFSKVAGDAGPMDEMLKRYLDDRAQHVIDQRIGRFTDGVSPDNIAERQADLRAFFIQQLGGFPKPTPLNARITGEGTGDGFRYEKVIYDSLPGVYVTAVLFLPETDGPYPAVLVPCGHSNNGKAAETYQRAAISLAQHGIAALVYDPIGQGERHIFLNEDGKPDPASTTLQHTAAGIGCILTGTNLAMYRIYDGMRGLDYLESREDIDASRLACSGNSGGGTLTSYIMALDDRVTVAAPSCYLTSFERLLATIGPQDAEQDIFGQLAFGMGHTEYVLMRAPKPTLICAAQNDFFDIGGTWETFRKAKTAYSFLGEPEAMEIAIANEKHGFSQPLREAMVGWMKRWLLDDGTPIVEREFEILSDAQMQCSPEGQVLLMDGARSTLDLSRERADALAANRGGDTAARAREYFESMRPGAGVVAAELIAEKTVDVFRVEQHVMRLSHEEGPGERLIPYVTVELASGATKGNIADFSDSGMLDDDSVVSLAREGHRVFAADVSGVGASRSREYDGGWRRLFGGGWPDYYRAYLAGKSVLHLRVEDMDAATRLWQEGNEGSWVLQADGELAVAGLHLAALEPERFERVELRGGPESWRAVVEHPRPRQHLMNAVHGALEHYDLPDLAALIPPEQLDWVPEAIASF